MSFIAHSLPLSPAIAHRYYQTAENGEKPDVWFGPAQVWEVKVADLSISPKYRAAAGLVDPEKGISLRFPRSVTRTPAA